MDGFKGHYPLLLRVERGFECSRLETELLASAYENLIPLFRGRLVDPRLVCLLGPREGGNDGRPLILKGA